MRLQSPRHAIAGFHASRPLADLPWLHMIGDEWLASRTDIAWHEHEQWEVYLQLEGQAEWQDRRRSATLQPGDGYLAPPGIAHRLGVVHGVRHHFLFAIIDMPGWVDRRMPGLAPLLAKAGSRFRTGAAEPLRLPLQLLCAAVTRDGPHRGQAVSIALDAVCLASITWAAEPAPASLRPEHPAVARVRARIDGAPGRSWSLAELADGTGLGAKHLCTRFGREVGQTPHQYLLSARIEGVKQALVESDLGIAAIALDLGFASSQHLSRVFARRVGVSPQRFRARYRG